MSDRTMRKVMENAGKQLQAVSGHIVPVAFLAALTANESYPPGNPDSKRFEPNVFAKLAKVSLGEMGEYNGVTAGMLQIQPENGESHQRFAFRYLLHLQNAATSWGYTQIMGYHVLRWGEDIADLKNPDLHYRYTLRLLSECPNDCRKKYGVEVDVGKDFEMMARWWNTGNPMGKTYHENYVPNILHRMEIWSTIAEDYHA